MLSLPRSWSRPSRLPNIALKWWNHRPLLLLWSTWSSCSASALVRQTDPVNWLIIDNSAIAQHLVLLAWVVAVLSDAAALACEVALLVVTEPRCVTNVAVQITSHATAKHRRKNAMHVASLVTFPETARHQTEAHSILQAKPAIAAARQDTSVANALKQPSMVMPLLPTRQLWQLLPVRRRLHQPLLHKSSKSSTNNPLSRDARFVRYGYFGSLTTGLGRRW